MPYLLELSCLAAFLIAQPIFYYFSVQSGENNIYHKQHWRRFWHIVNSEFFMLLFSGLIWNRIRKLCRNIPCLVRDLVSALLVLLLFSSHLSFFWYYFYILDSQGDPTPFAVFCFTSWALHVYLFSMLFACAIGYYTVRFLNEFRIGQACLRPFKAVRPVNAFMFNPNVQTIVCLILTLLFTVTGLYNALHWPAVKNVHITLDRLPREFDKYRIALLTDIHTGPVVGRTRIDRIVNTVNELQVDFVGISGDLTDGDMNQIWYALEGLRNLNSRLGTYYATGNHEYYHGRIDHLFDYLRTLNVTVLHNQHVKVREKQATLCLGGVDDVTAYKSGVPTHTMDVITTFDGCDTARLPAILLCHQPKGAKRILRTENAPRIDLILSGHTHGGQLLVISPIAYLINPYFLGLYRDYSSGTQIYVSAGVHFFGPPVKSTPLEITHITLHSGSKK